MGEAKSESGVSIGGYPRAILGELQGHELQGQVRLSRNYRELQGQVRLSDICTPNSQNFTVIPLAKSLTEECPKL